MSKLMDFSKYLKAERIKVGLSQAAVAKKLGYSSPQFISNWERGLARPPVKVIKRLISMYRLDIDETVEVYMRLPAYKLRSALSRPIRK